MWGSRDAVLAFLFALMVSVLSGQSQGAPRPTARPDSGSTTQWTSEDMVGAERGEQFRISPDGQWAVWVKHAPDADKDEMVSNLFLTSLTENLTIQLTRGPNHDANPRWSRDGRLIAFLSDRALPEKPEKEGGTPDEKSKTQLWIINARGGEPWPLTRLERDVEDFDWIDGETILMAAEEDPSRYERTLQERKDEARAIEDPRQSPPVRLFNVNATSGGITRFTTNDDWIESVAVSPNGRYAVAVHQRSLSYEFDEKIKPVTFLYDLTTGQGKPIFEDGKIVPGAPDLAPQIRWANDSSGFYTAAPYSTHPVYRQAYVSRLYYYDVGAAEVLKVDLGWKNELALEAEPAFAPTPDGFVALLADGARYKPARYTREGNSWKRAWIEGENAKNIFALDASQDGRTLVYLSSGASRPEQWYRASLEGASMRNPTQLTDLNPAFEEKTPARSEVVRWEGSLGEEVEGILYYPQDYEPGKEFPLVVMVHGGPLSMEMDAWGDRTSQPTNLYTQRGALVLKPNYHGSGNYGLEWAESIGGGKYYELEVPDIEEGVDHLIERGLADPDRLGVLGWSNGGILAAALTVATNRYKAAGVGAGDVEQASDWAYATFGAAFDNYYFGAAPIDDPQLYIRKSPMYEFKKVRTPTIIFSGTEDRAVGHMQAWEHFRTLQQLGQVPVRFISFPGEEHGLRKLSHRRRKVEEELAWFDKYLFKLEPKATESLKDDSPLAQMLKWRNVKRTERGYGVTLNGLLIPETVSYRGLQIGRFEVTRAQFAAFDKKYKAGRGQENFPANGISFDEAQAYCAWLSKLTGEAYRLSRVEELEQLYKEARDDENTLDYWAGYKVNPDDAERLRAKIGELQGETPLLKEVGSFPGRGDVELVFDLGGNVAEWAVDDNGEGVLLGGSADQPADPKSSAPAPSPAYIGFRVVK